MPSYAHTTKAAGTVLAGGAGGNYNTDHSNHVTNQTPQQTEDYSTDSTQARVKTDGYASGSDVLATDLSGELERLRYEIAVIKDYLNGHAPDGATTNAIINSSPTTVANTLYYDKIKNPMMRAIGCRVYGSAGVSHAVSGTIQAMTFDTERYDLDGVATGFHSTVSNTSRLTVPAGLGGIYHIGGCISIPVSTTGSVRVIAIRLNGTTYLAQSSPNDDPAAAAALEMHVSCDYKLAVADYVELMVNQDSGGALTIAGPNATTGPEFWMHLVGYGT